MDEKLKSFLDECTPAAVDQTTIDDLLGAMERAVPKIAESIRQRQRLAAHLRLAASKPPRSATNRRQDYESDDVRLSLS